ncbi:MAG TPA: peptidylprolyl isomerase [Candidatus Acidoferrum sp.]|nr:peptidylprolyl isomerase [Candidatus Acidoferrum sp.]
MPAGFVSALSFRLRGVVLLVLCACAAPLQAKPFICMQTNMGSFCMEMLPDAAPKTVANFLAYVSAGSYTNSLIHDSVAGVSISGGAYTLGNGISAIATNAPIPAEVKLSNLRGTVAMARSATDLNSATSQWFINRADNTNLDTANGGGYTVFARIVSGMDIVDAIGGLPVFQLGANIPSAPAIAVPDSTVLSASMLISVSSVTRIDPPAYQCSMNTPNDTLTEFCGTSLSFPVTINGHLYVGTLNYVGTVNGKLVFQVDTSQLSGLTDTGQARATFNSTNNTLTIPSVRSGSTAFTNVQLALTSSSPLQFTLTSYTPR